MDYHELLARCESEIEKHLLRVLYPNLGPDAQKEIQAQYMIDYYDMTVTLPDFAFPDLRFAGREILNETGAVVRTIEQAIRLWSWRDMFSIGGAFAAGLVAAVMLMVLIESFFPLLFYHLTSGF